MTTKTRISQSVTLHYPVCTTQIAACTLYSASITCSALISNPIISAVTIPRKDGPSWCEAAIYYADEDVVTSEPYNSFYNHWVCQTANATYHLYMGVADTE